MAKRRPVVATAQQDSVARYRLWLLLAVLVVVPLSFDAERTDAFVTVKLAVLACGASLLVAAMIVHWAVSGHRPRWRTPLHVLAYAFLAWTAVTTATGVSPYFSVLGDYGTGNGLVSVALYVALFVVVADTIRLVDLRSVAATIVLGAGGPVVLYALVQLHDSVLPSAPDWDPVQWQTKAPETWIWSTIGNPNHLAAFLVVVLPLAVVVAAVHPRRAVRVSASVLTAVLVVELLYTTARGAWVAAVVVIVVLGCLLVRDIRARVRLPVAVGGVAAMVVLVGGLGVATDVTPQLGRQVGSIFDPQQRTTVLRVELWRTAWRIAADRPLVGVGPEAYGLRFNQYQSTRFVDEFGPALSATAPHNTFLAHLAHGGVPLLALFVALLAVAGWRAVATMRILAAREDDARRPPARLAHREHRVLLAGFTAAAAGFVTQATFNSEMADLNMWLWVLLGVIAAAGADPGADEARDPWRPHLGLAIPACLVAAVVAFAGVSFGTRPYRADGRVAEARQRASVAVSLARQGELDRARGEALVAERLYEDALALNPRETSYEIEYAHFQTAVGELELVAGVPATRDEGIERLRAARSRFRDAVRRVPEYPGYLREYGRLLASLSAVGVPSLDHAEEAADVLARAHRLNPADPEVLAIYADLVGGRAPPEV